MRNYSEEFKNVMVAKLMRPGGPSALALSKKAGVSQTALSRWVRNYGTIDDMRQKSPKDWSAQEKLEAVLKSSSMSEGELGEYMRKTGFHTVELEAWKAEMLEAMKPRGRGRPRKDPEVVELQKANKLLEREIRRKDKALAEVSALLVLKKKAELIWGVKEDDELD